MTIKFGVEPKHVGASWNMRERREHVIRSGPEGEG